jgi:uncharacterized cupin superfamily protein
MSTASHDAWRKAQVGRSAASLGAAHGLRAFGVTTTRGSTATDARRTYTGGRVR